MLEISWIMMIQTTCRIGLLKATARKNDQPHVSKNSRFGSNGELSASSHMSIAFSQVSVCGLHHMNAGCNTRKAESLSSAIKRNWDGPNAKTAGEPGP